MERGEIEVRGTRGYDKALLRLCWLALIGCFVISLYASQQHDQKVIVFSVESLIAGAALLVGGLVGFLFGVPHTRDVETGVQKPQEANSSQEAEGQTVYRANTSLEQISDWLTKILVGVGLVEIKSIPDPLRRLVTYLAKGLPDNETSKTVVLVTLIYFSVCGFVFGFLWARIYLRKWFREADNDVVTRLGESLDQTNKKLSALEQRQQEDSNALALVSKILENEDGDDEPTPEQLSSAIEKASRQVRTRILNQAHTISSETTKKPSKTVTDKLFTVFEALAVNADPSEMHKIEAEIAYCFSRQVPPDLPEAQRRLSNAIRIRDENGIAGWKYFEFRRARTRIELDSNFELKQKTDPGIFALIVADLKVAHSEAYEQGIWSRWLKSNKTVSEWITLNEVRLD